MTVMYSSWSVNSCLAVSGLAAALYMNSINGDFVFDDHEAIENNVDVRSDTPLSQVFSNDFWGLPLSNPESHKSYRPLVILSFRLNRVLHGMWAPGFHIVNVVLHTVASVLYYFMLMRLSVGWAVAMFASVLFAIHPIHTEAVSNVVGRTELMAAVFFILSYLCYHNSLIYSPRTRIFIKEGHPSSNRPVSYSLSWIFLSVFFSLVSMLCKEQGVTVLGVCVAYDVLVACGLDLPEGIHYLKLIGRWLRHKLLENNSLSNHRNLKNLPSWLASLLQRFVLLTISGIIILLFRFYVNGRGSPLFVESDNPASFSAHFLTRALTYSYLLVLNLWLLVSPSRLCFDWSMGSVPLVENAADPRNIATCSLFVFLLLILLRTTGIWTVFFPKSDIVANTTADFSEHSPSSNSVSVHSSTKPNLSSSTADDVVVVSGHKKLLKRSENKLLHGRSETNDSPSTRRKSNCLVLFSVLLAVIPFLPASNLLFPVGFVLAERVLYLPSLGVCLLVTMGAQSMKSRMGRLGHLVNILMLLVVVGFSVKTVLRNAEWTNTETLGMAAVPVNPGNAKVLMTLGNIYAQQGQRKCELFYREALRLRPNYASAWTNLGLVLLNTDRPEEAESCYLKALSIKPDHVNANVNMGHLCRLQQRWSEANRHYVTALGRRPNNVVVRYYMGVVLEKMGGAENLQNAEHEYKHCLQLQSSHLESHIALARLLATVTASGRRLEFGYTKLKRLDQAIYHYQKALSLKPQQSEVHYELGKVLLSKGKRQEAKMEFLASLKLDPDHSNAHFELGKIHEELRDPRVAIQEFQTALKIDPDLSMARKKLQEMS